MRYFSYLSEQSFKTSEAGERLFYPNGPFFRPYRIPDTDVEQRLFRKLLWKNRILLGGLIVGGPFVFLSLPDGLEEPAWFLGYIAAVAFLLWAIQQLVFGTDFRRLPRADRLGLRAYYGQVAESHSADQMTRKLVGCVGLVLLGVLTWLMGGHWIVAVVCGVIFTFAAVTWGYALHLKKPDPEDSSG